MDAITHSDIIERCLRFYLGHTVEMPARQATAAAELALADHA